MNEALDEQCAEALGWVRRYSPDPTIYAWERPDGERVTRSMLPAFSTDRTAVMLLEDEIERRGLQDKYLIAISRILDDLPLPYEKGVMPPFLWQLLRATPEQRARAFLKVAR